jgi:hypothetical protein
MAAKRDRISELVDAWRKEHSGEPITGLLEASGNVTALKSTRLKDIRSFLAECENKKTALETEFPHLKRVYSPYSERQEDWEYTVCDDLIPYLRLEISRRGRTGAQSLSLEMKRDVVNERTNAIKAIGRNLDNLRKECGWSLGQLAAKTGIDKKSIVSHVKKRVRPTPRILKLYADAFTNELGRKITVLDLEK